MVIDPVCKMQIEPESADYSSEYEGKTYYFCSAACKNGFEKSPDKYLGKKKWWKFW